MSEKRIHPFACITLCSDTITMKVETGMYLSALRLLLIIICLAELITAGTLAADAPDMVFVPADDFAAVEKLEFVGIGPINARRETKIVTPHSFYIDKTEVTNEQYSIFLDETGYRPRWPRNFLKHWQDGRYPKGQARHPVVWVSIEDARAFAVWAGKRLPTEEEWQMAAQGPDGRKYPWGNLFDGEKANMDSQGTRAAGSYPAGASPYGCLDMAGNVWEWTAPVHNDGYHNYSWLRGGSFYLARGSFWYIQSGPVTSYQRVHFLHFTPAYNRCATVGFRCVKSTG